MTYLKEFINWLYDEGKDPKTIQAYDAVIRQFTTWYTESGKTTITEIKPIDIKDFLGYLKHTLNRKQTTINKAIAGLKTYFLYLVEQGFISDNPMTRIKIQKLPFSNQFKDSSKWLTKEEQDRFISYLELEKNEFKRLRNLAIVDIMLYAGLRVSEVVDLKIEDVKVNGDVTLTIREGKQGKFASVTLINKYSKDLRNWLKYRQSLTNELYLNSPYLFVSERSGQLTSRGIQMFLNKYASLSRIDKVTPHRFRHSFCKNLANANVNIEVIRRLARHESIQTTAIYVDPSQEEQLQALKKM